MDRQTDRQTGRQAGRQTERQIDRCYVNIYNYIYMIYVYLYIYMIYVYIYILRRVLLERIRNKSRAIFSPSRSTGRSPEPPWDGAHGVVGHYQRYQWQALTFGSTGNSTSRTTMFHTVSRCCKYKQSIYLLLQLIYIIIKILFHAFHVWWLIWSPP